LFGEAAVTVESATVRQQPMQRSTARWIVAKDMISEGTSIPRIRTVLILRDIKSPVKFEQTVHRATRNRSDEIAQDAKVIFFHLPEMIIFAGTIEDQIRLIVPAPRPTCPQCQRPLEYRPRQGKPCSHCGYEPQSAGPGASPASTSFEWLFSDFDKESVILQGGDDFSNYDRITRTVLDKLGPNPRVFTLSAPVRPTPKPPRLQQIIAGCQF